VRKEVQRRRAGGAKVRFPDVPMCVLVLCSLWISGPSVALAQSEDFEIPRVENGRPDFQGLWAGVPGTRGSDNSHPFFGERMDYLPEALAIKEQLAGRLGNDRTYFFCAGAAVPAQILNIPYPFLIFQDDSNVVLFHEYAHDVRVIPTDGSPHPDREAYTGLSGDSRGRWEGDTLVVDVTNFLEGNNRLTRVGDFLSGNARIVERWTLVAPDRLRYEITAEDPTVLASPWTVSDDLVRQPEGDWIFDTSCREGEQDLEHVLRSPDYVP